MFDYLTAARAIGEEIIRHRRTIHGYAEVGFELPKTVEYVMKTLREYGYEPALCGRAGVTCTVGHGGKVFLIRGDMDALPMREDSGEPFAATNGACHSCGHDCHPAMLLGAAKLLKAREAELKGTVKFMFQPAEELLSGAKDMIAAGLLENPHVDAGFGMHIRTGTEEAVSGQISYRGGLLTRSGDAMRITVHGKDAHGSKTNLGIDAISIAANIVIALNEVRAREIASSEDSVLLVGTIKGGTSANSVPGMAVLEASIRTNAVPDRDFIMRRVTEISTAIAAAYRGSVTIEHMYGAPPMITDIPMTDKLAGYARELLGDERVVEQPATPGGGGEDFAEVSAKIPVGWFSLGAGSTGEGYTGGMHNPKMRVNEAALPDGAAVYAHLAERWLAENA